MKTKNIFFVLVSITIWNLKSGSSNFFAQELIQDRDFQQGFFIRDTIAPYSYLGPIIGDSSLAPPVWNTAEWASKSSLRSIPRTTVGTGFYKWADNNKDFRFGPVGAEPYQLYFGVNSQNEYSNIYRLPAQAWPHLFVEQRLCAPYDFPGQGPGCPPLSDLDSLVFKIDAKLLYNQTIMTSGYDPNYHAAQFLVYFYVQNTNVASSGYGKYVWLGVPLYDDRYLTLPGQVSYDIATATLINSIPSADFASGSLHTGNWVHAQLDLLPYALAALDTAWANGFLNQSTDIADYKISGIVIGWELPGMNICTVGIKGVSLFAYSTPNGIDQEENGIEYFLNVSPNPSNGMFKIQASNHNAAANGQMEIYNVFGEKIHSAALSQSSIDLSGKPDGIYFINIKTDAQSFVGKLIIKK